MLFRSGGSVVAGAVIAAPAVLVPDTLFHFTTTSGYESIVASGQIAQTAGVDGAVGTYGTVGGAGTVSWAMIPTKCGCRVQSWHE